MSAMLTIRGAEDPFDAWWDKRPPRRTPPLIVLAVIAANRRAIGHAASIAVHVLEVAAEVAAGLAVAIGVTASVLVIHHRAARRAAAAAGRERVEIPASVRVLGPPGRTPAELPAPEPSGHLRWPYVTRGGRRTQ
ncbi:MAG TPA: hypothetical protein VLW50_25860 [Streptosporangiaceae bacterium]|nr:hypothetical protein [Streptosporangiaceae bacterium]